MQEMKTTLVTAITLAALGLTVDAAQARVDDTTPRSITVNVQDLNLATARGQDVLRRRIRWAADIVCGNPDARDLRILAGYRNCVNEATNGALAQIKFPRG
jgi:UrcA family protein